MNDLIQKYNRILFRILKKTHLKLKFPDNAIILFHNALININNKVISKYLNYIFLEPIF